MDATTAEKAKARRTLRILYVAMAVGMGLPVILYFCFHHV
jgi:hypothetical protein